MKRIGVLGSGRFGSTLAEALVERGVEVVLMDMDKQVIQRMSAIPNMRAVQGDVTNENALIEAGIRECEAVVVAISENMEAGIMATVMLKELKVPMIVAKASSDIQVRVLERLGADMVVSPEKDRANRLARTLISASALDIFEVADGVSIAEIELSDGLAGKTLTESKIRIEHGVTVLVIRKKVDESGKARNIVSPSGNDVLEKGDVLIVFGADKDVESLSKALPAVGNGGPGR